MELRSQKRLMVFSGSANEPLAEEVARNIQHVFAALAQRWHPYGYDVQPQLLLSFGIKDPMSTSNPRRANMAAT